MSMYDTVRTFARKQGNLYLNCLTKGEGVAFHAKRLVERANQYTAGGVWYDVHLPNGYEDIVPMHDTVLNKSDGLWAWLRLAPSEELRLGRWALFFTVAACVWIMFVLFAMLFNQLLLAFVPPAVLTFWLLFSARYCGIWFRQHQREVTKTLQKAKALDQIATILDKSE